MYCPRCGNLLEIVNGELTCIRGNMGLSKNMEAKLTECYVTKNRIPIEAKSTIRWGGNWYCPGCGIKAIENTDGQVKCPTCSLCMNEFLYALIERHPHA